MHPTSVAARRWRSRNVGSFLGVSLALILGLPRVARWFFGRYGDRVIEPELKLVFACLLLLTVLADVSNGHAALPAFVLGLVMSQHYTDHREEQTISSL